MLDEGNQGGEVTSVGSSGTSDTAGAVLHKGNEDPTPHSHTLCNGRLDTRQRTAAHVVGVDPPRDRHASHRLPSRPEKSDADRQASGYVKERPV